MSRHTERLLAGRENAPDELRGITLDAWLLPFVLESLEPAQRDLIEWLLCGEPKQPLCTDDLCVAVHATPTRLGVLLSRLRRLGLVKTHYKVGEDRIRRAYHVAVPWLVAADRMRLQWEREQVRELLR